MHSRGFTNVPSQRRRFVFRAVLAMVLAHAASSAADVWIEIGVNDKFTAYADPATSKRDGDMVKMWNMFDYKTAQSADKGKKFLSTKLQYEYDCKAKRVRKLAATSFAESKAKGDKVAEGNAVLPWNAVVTGSADDLLLTYACKK